ncbi:MAG: response regulator [Desulfobacteraceae bacterium]|nr:response regulator [Desulfobacteraceae bacterium]
MARILIVDDEASVRDLISEELAEEGYEVSSVGSPESLWAALRSSVPDVVLLDLYLNGVKGWEVLSRIKRQHPDLPVLIVTAYDNFAEDPRVSQADGYVVKNFVALDELKRKIGGILKKKEIEIKVK